MPGRPPNAKGFAMKGLIANLVLYIFGPLCSGMSALSWLKPGRLVARGDIFPYVFYHPNFWASRIWWGWDTRLDLGGPADFPKYATMYFFSRLLHLVADGAAVQHAFYCLMLGAQFAAMAFLMRTMFPGKYTAAFVAASFYVFNVSMMQVLPFPMFMFFLAYTPLMLALLIRGLAGSKSNVSLSGFVVLSSLSGFLFMNPPTYLLFILAALVMAIALVTRTQVNRRDFVRIGLAVAGTLAVNVYWMIPSYMLLFGAGHDSVHAVTDNSFLNFVSRRAQMLNVLWLQPYWAWGYPMYYPFAFVYTQPFMLICEFIAPVLFFSAWLNNQLPRWIRAFAVPGVLVLMLLTAGEAEPYGAVGWFMMRHFPLFWLFREPTTKFPLLTVMLMAPLVGLQLAWLAERAQAWARASFAKQAVRYAIAAVVLVAMCIPAFPMVTGQVEGARNYGGIALVSNGVRIPAYWDDLSRYLRSSGADNRVLFLPNDDFYQINYDWGLYAADPDVIAEIISNPFVLVTNSSYQFYLSGSRAYSRFQNALYQSVVSRIPQDFMPELAVQGIRYVVERDDLNWKMPDRELISPLQAHSMLRQDPKLRLVRRFGPLEVYRVTDGAYVPPLYLRGPIGNAESKSPYDIRLSRAAVRLAPFRMISPTSVSVDIPPGVRGKQLVYAEYFDRHWNACVVANAAASKCLSSNLHHSAAYGFENAWTLPDSDGGHAILIYYGPQTMVNAAERASLAALIAVILVWGWLLVRYRTKGKLKYEGVSYAPVRPSVSDEL